MNSFHLTGRTSLEKAFNLSCMKAIDVSGQCGKVRLRTQGSDFHLPNLCAEYIALNLHAAPAIGLESLRIIELRIR